MFTTYIILSESSLKYYVGQTKNLEDRLHRHNSGHSLSTKCSDNWKLIYKIEFSTRSEAVILERKI